MRHVSSVGLAVVLAAAGAGFGLAETGEPTRVTQAAIDSGEVSLQELRGLGRDLFSTRFTRDHGYGDGPLDFTDTVRPGGRPSLQGNGMLLRVNGLDGQSCVECHSIIRADEVPPVFGVGGVGGSVSNAIIQPTDIDPADLADFDGAAGFNGRFANPPFVFGAGAVELLALEMTEDLLALRRHAIDHPDTVVELTSKGVRFGTIVADLGGEVDTSAVEGVDPDLVVKPFGRKGEFATAREFDIEALQFHFGMQPVETVGAGFDGDGDGVVDEVLVGELSALSAFVATMQPPRTQRPDRSGHQGSATFEEIGCASCHIPTLVTRDRILPLRFPEIRTDPRANTYMRVDLSRPPTNFRRNGEGGIVVPLFADLKRHDMGPELAESFALADEQRNREFTTARLWGIADTAPYLHDGRATTLGEAILMHGGDAQEARDAFAGLGVRRRNELIAFLRSLRTPVDGEDHASGVSEGTARR